jgi:hypothetical protein
MCHLDLYSYRLWVVLIAMFCPAPLQLEPDLQAKFPCRVIVAAAAISLWILPSGSVVVATHVPATLQRLGGAIHERGWWTTTVLA